MIGFLESNGKWDDFDEEFFIKHIGQFSDQCVLTPKIELLQNYLDALNKRRESAGFDVNRARQICFGQIAKCKAAGG